MVLEKGKLFVSANDLYKDSFSLAEKIHEAKVHPNWIVGVWRGGAPVGMCVQEYFRKQGVVTDHISIRTSSYTAPGVQSQSEIRVHGLEYIVENANASDTLLLVDDIHDSGRTIQAIKARLLLKMRLNCPKIIVATLYFKPMNNKTVFVPDFYLHETNQWIVFPHELDFE